MVDFERLGQYIFNKLEKDWSKAAIELHGEYDGHIFRDNFHGTLFYIKNDVLYPIIKEYIEYLINKDICPECNGTLTIRDRFIEGKHCHTCTWSQE